MNNTFDYIIIGAGIYGMYATKILGKKGYKVALLEGDNKPFERATFINQARLHSGYHYPRSNITAEQSIKYFDRFYNDFNFAINKEFKKIYAISNEGSHVNAKQFKQFCNNFNIKCEEIDKSIYFKNNSIETAFDTLEYSFDSNKIRDFMYEEIKNMKNVSIFFGAEITSVEKETDRFIIKDSKNDKIYQAKNVINTTYASLNQIIQKFNFEKFDLKYELCEVILCEVNKKIKNVGLTVMDGPFFSIMPFGLQGIHSLTSVQYTPHSTGYEDLPKFECQKYNPRCSKEQLANCNKCLFQPKTAFDIMEKQAKQYLADDIEFKYKNSLFAIKSILLSSENDDGRPTIIKTLSNEPKFISVLSGKINTFYEMDEILI